MTPKVPRVPDPPVPVFSNQDETCFAEYFLENGFVVVDGVLNDEEVEATVDELWTSSSLLGGREGLRREEPSTWDGESWPAGCRNFLDPLEPCSEVTSWRNRVNPKVHRVFEVLWQQLPSSEEAAEGHLVASVDRFGLMRPTQFPGDEGLRERPEWRTSRNWLHWDQNPWATPGFHAVQGLVALTEGTATSGGFVTVPGLTHQFHKWCQDHPDGSIPGRTKKTIPFSVPLDDEMQDRRVKVLVPRGGLIVWDSRMPHESFPNEDENWRIVQYITFRRMTHEELSCRAGAWRAGLRSGLIPASFGRRFSFQEQRWLGMAVSDEEDPLLEEALAQGENLHPQALEAAKWLRRAYRLKQTAMEPSELKEASALFKAAFEVNPELKEPLRLVAAAEELYLPFWIL